MSDLDIPVTSSSVPPRERLTCPMEAGRTRHVLILGDDQDALHLSARLEKRGMIVVARLGIPPLEGRWNIGDLAEILRYEVVDEIVSVLPLPRYRDEVAGAFRLSTRLGVPFHVGDSHARSLNPHIEPIRSLGEGLPYVRISSFRRCEGLPSVVKSLGDRVLACVMILMGLPLFPMIAIAIKIGSSGPVIFRQVRVRNNGRHFYLYKFRTMVANAEELKSKLLDRNEVDGPAFKIEGDPRVTSVGRILRHFRMDELPQLFNVVRGEMSFVGPRPPLPDEVARYEDWYLRRLSVTPGLTCLWQLDGPLGVGFEEWMRLDLAYIEQWSLWLDLKIFLKTIPLVLLGTRAM